MRLVSLIFTLIVAMMIASFAILNATRVTVDYYLGAFTLPLSLLLACCFVAGALTGMASMLPKIVRMKHRQWQLKTELKQHTEHDSHQAIE